MMRERFIMASGAWILAADLHSDAFTFASDSRLPSSAPQWHSSRRSSTKDATPYSTKPAVRR